MDLVIMRTRLTLPLSRISTVADQGRDMLRRQQYTDVGFLQLVTLTKEVDLEILGDLHRIR